MLAFKTSGTQAQFISFYSNNTTRMGYFGKETSGNNNFVMVAERGDLKLSGNNIIMNNKRVQQVATPTNNTDAANKQYVDQAIANNSGLKIVTFTGITKNRVTLNVGETINLASQFGNYPNGYSDYVFSNIIYLGVTDNRNDYNDLSKHSNGPADLIIAADKYMLNNRGYSYFYARNVGETINNKYLMFQFTMIKGVEIIKWENQ